MIPEDVAVIAEVLCGGPLSEVSEDDEREVLNMAWKIYNALQRAKQSKEDR